jgi:hypothetical protein
LDISLAYYTFASRKELLNIKTMGAAGNKKPKKAKAGKHEAKYESDELMNSASTKGQKKKLH